MSLIRKLLKYSIKDFINKTKIKNHIKKFSKENFTMYNSMKNPLFKTSEEIQNNRTLCKCILNSLKDSLFMEGFQIYGLKSN